VSGFGGIAVAANVGVGKWANSREGVATEVLAISRIAPVSTMRTT
jgi:hypothetical protein